MSTGDLRPFERSLPMALMRAREVVMQQFRPLLAEHDLTEQQWRVLRALSATVDGHEIRELAEATFLLGPSLSRIIANLEGRELVNRLPVEGDLRRSRIVLAPAGAAVVRTMSPKSEDRYAVIEAEFGSDRLAQLYDLLDELGTINT